MKAVYSRSKASVDSLLSSANPPLSKEALSSIATYYDSPNTEKNLDALLAREDIHAVIIAIPITVQPEVIRKALSAGKHVLSEKPVAKDVETAKGLISWARDQGINGHTAPTWGVAENWRFINPVVFAEQRLREVGGDIVTFSLEVFTLIADDDKFFNTDW